MKQLKFITLLICISFLFVSCDIKDVKIDIPTNVELQKLSLDAIKLKIYLPIENQNNFSFNIKGADLGLYLNGKYIGKINKIEKIKVEANSKNTYPIYFEINPKESLTNAFPLLKELQGKNSQFKINGHIKVSKFLINRKLNVNHVI
ncbi:LEA type 2 family protein [Bacteroidales bacterium OttesenSCG-928-I21]|nr:LEA type 2 family protein [Bacteroidales bacterium OttesenSCG-928-I21]